MKTNTLSSRVILIFFGFTVFLIFSFALLQIISTNETSNNIMERNLNKLVTDKKELLDLRMEQIELEVRNLGDWLYEYAEGDFNIAEANFTYYKGMIIDPQEDLKTSLFVTRKTAFNDQVKKQIDITKYMEDRFINTLQRNKNIVCVYIISKDGVLRVYPYMDINAFTSDHDFTKDYYFQAASQENNPYRKVIWTKPYYDWADRGWVVTCAYPIYIDNNLSYVIFADVTLDFLQEAMTDFQIDQFGYGFIIGYDGQIIYHPKQQIQPLDKGAIHPGDAFSLTKNDNHKNIIGDMAKGKTGQSQYYNDDDGCYRLISYAPIDRVQWSIGFDVNREEYDISVKSHINRYFFIPIITSTIVLTLGYRLLKRMAQPIEILSTSAKKIASGELVQLSEVHGVEDINSIVDSINTLSLTARDYMMNLIRANNKLEAVFNSINGLLFIVDKNYNIISMNKYGKQILKKSHGEMNPVGSFCYLFFKKGKAPCNDCPITKTIQTGKESFKEVMLGQNIFHVWTFPIFDDDENIEEIVVYSMKVTEQVIIKKEFYQREKLAAIGQMAASVTHELKNPLSVLKGCNYLLKNTIDNEEFDDETKKELEEIIEDIDNSINRSETIIYNLLDFSRKPTIEKEEIDLAALLEQIIILNRKYMIDQNIELSVRFSREPLIVFGNLDSMKHIFINVIENAIQSMPNGGELNIIGSVINDEKIEIEIEDSGYGMDHQVLENAFKPFFTTKSKENGTGLGLWIVKNELNKNNGEISFSSISGKGTRVCILFPKAIMANEESYG